MPTIYLEDNDVRMKYIQQQLDNLDNKENIHNYITESTGIAPKNGIRLSTHDFNDRYINQLEQRKSNFTGISMVPQEVEYEVRLKDVTSIPQPDMSNYIEVHTSKGITNIMPLTKTSMSYEDTPYTTYDDLSESNYDSLSAEQKNEIRRLRDIVEEKGDLAIWEELNVDNFELAMLQQDTYMAIIDSFIYDEEEIVVDKEIFNKYGNQLRMLGVRL